MGAKNFAMDANWPDAGRVMGLSAASGAAKKKTGLMPGLVQQGGETARVASITGS